MSPERAGFLVGTVMGAGIVIVGCLVAGFFVLRMVNKKMEAKEREARSDPAAPQTGAEMVPLFYVLSFMFWPAAFIAGAHLLGQPHTARAGRNCIAIGLLVITMVAVLTSVALVAVAALYGDKLPI